MLTNHNCQDGTCNFCASFTWYFYVGKIISMPQIYGLPLMIRNHNMFLLPQSYTFHIFVCQRICCNFDLASKAFGDCYHLESTNLLLISAPIFFLSFFLLSFLMNSIFLVLLFRWGCPTNAIERRCFQVYNATIWLPYYGSSWALQEGFRVGQIFKQQFGFLLLRPLVYHRATTSFWIG